MGIRFFIPFILTCALGGRLLTADVVLAKEPRHSQQNDSRNQAPSPLSANSPAWETAAGGKMQFDVASVKPDVSDVAPSSNFVIDSSDAFVPTGGLFSGANWPLFRYVVFAYKLDSLQSAAIRSQLPKWATTDRYDIQARATGNPTKDQFRLMVQDLLMVRFKLSLHFESHQMPTLALVPVKPGEFGERLRLHVDNPPCDAHAVATYPFKVLPTGFPEVCGVVVPLRPKAVGIAAGEGARDVSLTQIAHAFSVPGLTNLGRPVIDGTGLTGKYDFLIEWNPTPGPDASPETQTGPTFLEALKDQLGLKLVPSTGLITTVIIDHIEQPLEN